MKTSVSQAREKAARKLQRKERERRAAAHFLFAAIRHEIVEVASEKGGRDDVRLHSTLGAF